MRQKYRNDFAHCAGDHCIHRDKCERYSAHNEAVRMKLERVVCINADECRENYYCRLAIKEKK